ncbi:MAG: TerC family protein [Flammeovirgaceae bacterium]
MIEHLFTLLMLVILQAVLGLDNLLYISLESKRAPLEKQNYVRSLGIAIAMIFRILLLFVLIQVQKYFQNPFVEVHWEGIFEAEITVHSLIQLLGGAFIIYTATKEVVHMMRLEQSDAAEQKPASIKSVLFWIIIMNIVFSFDSILSAMVLTDNFWVMTIAIVMGGLLMIWLSGRVTAFLQKNRMYEVLGLFILFIVGIMLLTEGGHLAEMAFFGQHIEPMTKTTFYFVIAVLVLTDVVQSRYEKNLESTNEEGKA